MKKSLIAMTSITYAMKAKNLLNSLKDYCEIQRTPKDLGTGCGYSIAVTAPSEEITAVRADIFFFTASGKPISCPASTPVHLAHTGNCQPWKKKLLSGR